MHQLFKINASAAQVSLSVQINSQLNWTVTVASNNIPADFFSRSEFDADTKLVSSQQALHLLSYLDKCQLCIGNTDEKFLCLYKNDTTSGTYNFSLKHLLLLVGALPAIRHPECQILLPPWHSSTRCTLCVRQRASLRMKVWRQSVTDADKRTLPSSHANYKCLSQPELVKRLTNEHQLRQKLTKQNLRLREKIAMSTETFGLEVEEELTCVLHLSSIL